MMKATKKNSIATTYSQVDMACFLPTSRPLAIIHPPEPKSPQPTITTRRKRVFEEGLQLLEDDYVKKKARLNELDRRIKEIMVEIEDFEKKKRKGSRKKSSFEHEIYHFISICLDVQRHPYMLIFMTILLLVPIPSVYLLLPLD
ncbi:unnamed protein product [Mucor circinelloides]